MGKSIQPNNADYEIENIEAAYRAYIKHFPKKASCLKTTIFHYLLPYKGFGLNFAVNPKEQIREARIKEGWELAKKIKLSDLWEIKRVLTWQEEIFDSHNSPSHVRQPNKHYLKHFLEWCREQGHIKPPETEEWAVPQSLPGASKAFHQRGRKERNLIVGRDPILEYGVELNLLFNQPKLEFREFSNFWGNQNYEGIRPIRRLIEESTLKKRLERLSYVIGWLVLDKLDYHYRMCGRAKQRKEKDSNYESAWLSVDPEPPQWLLEMQEKYPPRSLATLELNDLIPLIEIRSEKLLEKVSTKQESTVEQNNFDCLLTKIQEELKAQNAALSFETIVQLSQALHHNQSFAKEVGRLNQISAESRIERAAKAQMQEACIKVRALLKNFFRWQQYQHNPTDASDGYRISPNYRASFCSSLMSVAKFRYREITQPRNSPDYADIEVITELGVPVANGPKTTLGILRTQLITLTNTPSRRITRTWTKSGLFRPCYKRNLSQKSKLKALILRGTSACLADA